MKNLATILREEKTDTKLYKHVKGDYDPNHKLSVAGLKKEIASLTKRQQNTLRSMSFENKLTGSTIASALENKAPAATARRVYGERY